MTRSSQLNQARILVADDDTQVRNLFIRQLQKAGYDPIGASSGKAALSALRQSHYDLLILDLAMPDVDGFEVLRQVRADMPHLRVIAISGFMQGALLEAASLLGATITLTKTDAPEMLVETVKRLLP